MPTRTSWANGMSRTSKTIWVSLPYATYGIVVCDGKVVDAAPIARWMIGKDTHSVREWIKKKGGIYKVLSKEEV